MAVSPRGCRRRTWRLRRPGCRRGIAAVVLFLQSGCHVYAPVFGQQPVPGRRYAFEVTDRGRIDLSDRLGPSVESVEGTLLEIRDDAYRLSVAGVKTIGAPQAHWGGEQVAIPVSAVARISHRRLHKGRTMVALAVAAVSIGTFIATRGLFGFGPAGTDEKLPPPVDQ